MGNIEIGRRLLLKGAGAAALAAVVSAGLPERVNADGEWAPGWDYSQVNIPAAITGGPDERASIHLLTAEGNTAAITCGPVSYTDQWGAGFNFSGGKDRASIVIVKGPIGPAHDGAEVNPKVLPLYNWVGVTQNPLEGLKDVHLEIIAREREASLRSPQGGNFSGSQIDVAIIDGRNGAILETRTMFPKR